MLEITVKRNTTLIGLVAMVFAANAQATKFYGGNISDEEQRTLQLIAGNLEYNYGISTNYVVCGRVENEANIRADSIRTTLSGYLHVDHHGERLVSIQPGTDSPYILSGDLNQNGHVYLVRELRTHHQKWGAAKKQTHVCYGTEWPALVSEIPVVNNAAEEYDTLTGKNVQDLVMPDTEWQGTFRLQRDGFDLTICDSSFAEARAKLQKFSINGLQTERSKMRDEKKGASYCVHLYTQY